MIRTAQRAAMIGVAVLATLGTASAAAASNRGHTGTARSATRTATWTQRAVCPGSGLVLTVTASHVRARPVGNGPTRAQRVTAKVVARSPRHRAVRVAVDSRVISHPPGATVVTGRSVELAPGGGPYVVDGTAYLAPDGFLGHTTGRTASLCGAMGG